MGKLFFSGLITAICLLWQGNLTAQDKEGYSVFEATGRPMLNDSVVLAKGMFIRPGNFITLGEGDKLLLTDSEGALYEINKKVIMPFGRIAHYTKKEEQSHFTLTYLKYIWEKLWKREEKDNVGVVFRANKSTLLLEPRDSVQWYGSGVSFRWVETSSKELQYLYVKETASEKVTKLATNGDLILVSVDSLLLKPGSSYQWSVTTEPDADFSTMQFHSLELLDQETFNSQMSKMEGVRKEFETLGLTEEQIKKTFCEDRNFCYH